MKQKILKLLEDVYQNNISPEDALEEFKFLPFQNIIHTKIDTHRSIRTELPEVIFGKNKSFEEIRSIIENFLKKDEQVLVTKLQKYKAEKIKKIYNSAKYYPKSKVLIINEKEKNLIGDVTVISAGTSDISVAEEAYLTLKFFGSKSEIISDVGIAGLHRLLEYKDSIYRANIIVAVAGMEGALPSVIAGIFGKPIVAVPTSVGYGTNFNGVTPLLSMLNSCAPGIAVVNIDNGFGAGVYAHLINIAICRN